MKTIPCKNPDHPIGYSRDSMILLEESAVESVWACKACKEVLKVVSAQVRTKPAYQQHVREQLRREGRLPERHPGRAPMPRMTKKGKDYA